MSVPPVPCPNCGMPWPADTTVCPNCGMLLDSVWPPAPTGAAPLAPALPKTLTGLVWTDFLTGAAVQYLAHLATARVLLRFIPTTSSSSDWITQATTPGGFVLCEIFWAGVFGLLVYYALRRPYPFLARGSGYATLALLAVLLGAFFTCRPLVY